MSGVNLALLTGETTTFRSTGTDSAYTRITVDGQLFNSTANYVLGVNGSGVLAASGTFASYTPTGEGLTGEGTYSPVNVTYTATAVQQRTVTAGAITLGNSNGRFMSTHPSAAAASCRPAAPIAATPVLRSTARSSTAPRQPRRTR